MKWFCYPMIYCTVKNFDSKTTLVNLANYSNSPSFCCQLSQFLYHFAYGFTIACFPLTQKGFLVCHYLCLDLAMYTWCHTWPLVYGNNFLYSYTVTVATSLAVLSLHHKIPLYVTGFRKTDPNHTFGIL